MELKPLTYVSDLEKHDQCEKKGHNYQNKTRKPSIFKGITEISRICTVCGTKRVEYEDNE